MPTISTSTETVRNIIDFLERQEECYTGGYVDPYKHYGDSLIEEFLKNHSWATLPTYSEKSNMKLTGDDIRRYLRYHAYQNRMSFDCQTEMPYSMFMSELKDDSTEFADFLIYIGVLSSDLFIKEWLFDENYLSVGPSYPEAILTINQFNHQRWWLTETGIEFFTYAFQLFSAYRNPALQTKSEK